MDRLDIEKIITMLLCNNWKLITCVISLKLLHKKHICIMHNLLFCICLHIKMRHLIVLLVYVDWSLHLMAFALQLVANWFYVP